MNYSHAFLAGLLVVTSPAIVQAQTFGSSPGVVLTLGLGATAAPDYLGSDDIGANASGVLRFHGLSLGNGRSFGSGDPWNDALGFGVGGSFRFIGERDSSDHGELAGLDDIDAAIELGVSASYTEEAWRVFANIRRGFGGHEAWVGELGADVIARPTDDLRLTAGPRLFYGADGFVDTYFGVSATEASAVNPAFDAEGGLVSAGIELGARYRISDTWGVEGTLGYQRYRGDAADSPIVANGSDDALTLSIGVTRVLRLGGY